MTKEEKLKSINKAVEEYMQTGSSINILSEKYKVSTPTLSKYIKLSNIEIIRKKNKRSAFNLALEELNFRSAEEVSLKYGIDYRILLEANKRKKNSYDLKKFQIACAINEYVYTDGFHRSINKISKKYGLNKKTLAKYLKLNQIEITKKNDFPNCYEEAFDVIDTEEKAYWLGFLYADGYVCTNEFSIGLNLSIKDIDHLRKFKNFIKYQYDIKISQTHQFGSKSCYGKNGRRLFMCSIKIGNKHLRQSLIDKGCIPRKSLILSFPDESVFKDKSLIRHFIRGYFDGDGTISSSKRIFSIQIVGTKNILEHIQEYLGIGYLRQKKNCNEHIYRLTYFNKKAKKAAKIMYDNSSIYLQRKYNIYLR